MPETPDSHAPRVAQLADSIGYTTEEDFIALAGITPSTAEAWRKRGEGPAYVRAGRSFLYPKAGIADWLHSRLRARHEVAA